MATCQKVYAAERNETVRAESFGDKEGKYSKKNHKTYCTAVVFENVRKICNGSSYK